MRRRLASLFRVRAGLLALLLLSLAPSPGRADTVLVTVAAETGAQQGYRDFRRPPSYGGGARVDATLRALARDYGLTRTRGWPIRALGVYCEVFETSDGVGLEPLLQRLRADPRVDAAQAMLLHHTQAAGYDDPLLPAQHAFATLRLDAAHALTRGDGSVVAVVDAGIEREHPDLGGHVDARTDFTDGRGVGAHGTAIAGLIAAQPDNGMGIVGVAPGARVLDLKACWAESPRRLESVCDTLSLARALDAAIEARVRVINLSLSGPDDPLLGRLIERAVSQGASVVAAAGGGKSPFPASRQDVIPVSGRAPTGTVQAPADGLMTTLPGGTYDYVSGDSFAAAQVAGLVVLLRARYPWLTPGRVRELLLARQPLDVLALLNATSLPAAAAAGSGGVDR